MRRTSATRPVLALLCSSLWLSSPLLAQRSDRAVISGVVTDAQGAAVPGATVTVRNEATGVEIVLTTNGAGAYASSSLVLGRYTVAVALDGFKTSVTSGIELAGGDVARRDVTLEVGEVTERVEVVAEEGGLSDVRPDVSHKVDAQYYRDLPIIAIADVRLAESVLAMQPGYLPMTPNGEPAFRGSQFNSRISGGQARSTENIFDGGAFGHAAGHQESHESAPPVEAIEEVTVVTTTYAAEYGHTSGGVIEYTSKSGTNQLRGSAYGYLAHDALNSPGFFDLPKTPLENANWGLTLGGPIAKKKTFFFVNADWNRYRSGAPDSFRLTTPIDAFREGDFSALLSGAQVGTDVLGRPIFQGQIFDPSTTRVVDGVPVRDPYPGNVIPADDPLRSQVAARIESRMVHPDRPGLLNNVAGGTNGVWERDVRNLLARIDHNFTPDHRLTLSGYYNDRPAISRCEGAQGCDTEFPGRTEPERNSSYFGGGISQHIYTVHAHAQYDWIMSDELLSHSHVSWDRWRMEGSSLAAGAGWPRELWGSQEQSGLLDPDAGPPFISFHGGVPYSLLGRPILTGGYEINDRWQFSTDLAWVTGRSTLKAGLEYRHHRFRQRGWDAFTGGGFGFHSFATGAYDAQGRPVSQTGDPFASFLLGQVGFAQQQIPDFPEFREAYIAPWISAELKVGGDLTLTAGLRFDYQFARTEANDQYSSFDPGTPNPGAGNAPGALIYAGTGPGRSGKRSFERPRRDAWGPRLGFAYRLDDQTMVRGGYGIYYAGVSFSQFAGLPTLGFSANPMAVSVTNGRTPAFHLDDGFPRELITRPPFIDPAFANGGDVPYVLEEGLTLPRYQNWSVTLKRQLTDNMMLDVSYIGNRGSRLGHHWQRRGLDANMNDPAILALGPALLSSPIGSQAAVDAGFSPPYDGFTGSVAQSLRRYPQYQRVMSRGAPLGRSQYHALQVVLEQRLSRGLQYRLGYTLSRLKNNGAESAQSGDGANGGVQNPVTWDEVDWGLSRDDTPHVLLLSFSWDLPGSESWTGLKKALLHGWNLSGILRYESGRPLGIFMANDLAGLLFNGSKRPDRVPGVDGVAAGGDFDPNTDSYLNRDAWSDPGPLEFGNAPRRDGSVRGFPVYNEDISVSKTFELSDRARLRFQLQVGNLLNRTTFCAPITFWSAPDPFFGQVGAQCNQPRSVQLGLRVDY